MPMLSREVLDTIQLYRDLKEEARKELVAGFVTPENSLLQGQVVAFKREMDSALDVHVVLIVNGERLDFAHVMSNAELDFNPERAWGLLVNDFKDWMLKTFTQPIMKEIVHTRKK